MIELATRTIILEIEKVLTEFIFIITLIMEQHVKRWNQKNRKRVRCGATKMVEGLETPRKADEARLKPPRNYMKT